MSSNRTCKPVSFGQKLELEKILITCTCSCTEQKWIVRLKEAGLSVGGGGRGFPPATMNVVNGYFQERLEPKETPSCLISRQLEILATNAAKQCINLTVQKLTNVNH